MPQDDLIRILDSKTTEDTAAFSDVWVNRKGMPTLTFRTDGQELEIRQHDPYNRGLLWPQRFAVTLCGERDSVIRVNMTDTLFRMQLPFVPSRVLPNTDGRGYGVFVPDEPALHWLAAHWWEIEDDTARQSLLMVLYENYLAKHISADDWVNSLITGLPAEKNALVASTASGYLANVMGDSSGKPGRSRSPHLYDDTESSVAFVPDTIDAPFHAECHFRTDGEEALHFVATAVRQTSEPTGLYNFSLRTGYSHAFGERTDTPHTAGTY